LLTDDDENVRQYSLHSLGYFGKRYPTKVMPFIERFRKSHDFTMKSVAAHLLTHLSTAENMKFIFSKFKEWFKEGDLEFLKDVSQKIADTIKKGEIDSITLDEFIEWTKSNFDNKFEISK
jgi:hypothetical protein